MGWAQMAVAGFNFLMACLNCYMAFRNLKLAKANQQIYETMAGIKK